MVQNNKQIDMDGYITMKELNKSLKGIRILCIVSLALVLQAKACMGTDSKQGRVTNVDLHGYRAAVKSINDISNPTKNGGDTLFNAVNEGNIGMIQVLLEQIQKDKDTGKSYAYSNFPNTIHTKTNQTALGLAIKKGNTAIIDLLLRNQFIDPNKAGNNRSSFAYALDMHSNAKLAQHLWQQVGDKLNITDPLPTKGKSPLQIAIRKGFDGLVSTLLDKLISSNNKELLWNKDAKGRTFLHTAAQNHKCHLVFSNANVERILKEKENIGKLTEKDNEGHDVFANAYLNGSALYQSGIKNFGFLLSKTIDHLNDTQKEKIKDDISALRIKGKIRGEDADKLFNLVAVSSTELTTTYAQNSKYKK